MQLMWPERDEWPVRTVPIAINTVQHPLPSPARCFSSARRSAARIESLRRTTSTCVVLGTGGLSHQLDGERAGFINKEFDLMCMDKIVDDPQALTRYSSHQTRRSRGHAGRRTAELARHARRADRRRSRKVHGNYHIPISNTASALLVLDNRRPNSSARPADLIKTMVVPGRLKPSPVRGRGHFFFWRLSPVRTSPRRSRRSPPCDPPQGEGADLQSCRKSH